jgi:hypothetical protein
LVALFHRDCSLIGSRSDINSEIFAFQEGLNAEA